MTKRFYLILSCGMVALLIVFWVWFKYPPANPVSGEGGGKKNATYAAKPFPELTSKKTWLLPTYGEPIDDFPPNWEEGYGDFSDKGMRRVWREMGAGELPEFLQPTKGHHRARMDTGKISAMAVVNFQCNDLSKVEEVRDHLVKTWRARYGHDPEKYQITTGATERNSPDDENRPKGLLVASCYELNKRKQDVAYSVSLNPFNGKIHVIIYRGWNGNW
jgi:hypothetical protein